MAVGKSINRVDAYDKVTGRAMYTDDLAVPGTLVAKLVHSTVANGLVTSISTDEARQVPGVVAVYTCFDVPQRPFPTAGHVWSVEPARQDVSDKLLLTSRVRVYGDDIAVVVARDEVAANLAAQKVKAEYDKYPALRTVQEALDSTEAPLHTAFPGNILKHTDVRLGEESFGAVARRAGTLVVDAAYSTQTMHHGHIEEISSFAYMENGRVVVVSATQIPHITRRVVGQALGIPWGMVRIIKPTVGGSFGNKQEVLYEPLAAWLTQQLGGRPVKIVLSRAETTGCTRVRHALQYRLQTVVDGTGKLLARKGTSYSNQGGYASHGHAISGNGSTAYRMLYPYAETHEFDAYTVFTNLPAAGAMRGYGIPQIQFALESHMDDIAYALHIDPIELRKRNCIRAGHVDPLSKLPCSSNGLVDCMERGRQIIGWDKKRMLYQNQTGPVRRGVGMAAFYYKSSTYPLALEMASARLVLNQDGSVQVSMGATEIGQGSDTVFTQMAADAVGLSVEKVHFVNNQDTDVTPFDPGAYASRQTYASGLALQQAAGILREKILAYAAELLEPAADALDLAADHIVLAATGQPLMPLADLAMEAFYSLRHSEHLTAECTHQCSTNTLAFGAGFAEVEVDLRTGEVAILNMVNVHDSGTLINPKLAEAQVHGGMSMGLGYALGERLFFDDQCRPLNANLLDYPLPTALDQPDWQVDFIDSQDATTAFGNKSLGEPPAIPPAPAIRNAILHATGVAVNHLPMDPECLVNAFAGADLIESRGDLLCTTSERSFQRRTCLMPLERL